MKYYESCIPFDHVLRKFYSRKALFNNFENITEEKLKNIQDEVNNYINRRNESNTQKRITDTNLKRYQDVINFLTSTNVALTLKTFDEQLVFLILFLDPELEIFKIYLNSDITTRKIIEKAKTEEEKKTLTEKRKEELNILKSTLRDQLSFFDSQMLNYEKILFDKIFKKRKLLKNITINLVNNLLDFTYFIDSVDSITDEDFKRLNERAQLWISESENPNDYKTATFNILKQKEYLGLKNVKEMLIFFLLIVDPDLKALEIYEEESKIENITRRITEEFGFYNENIIKLEKMFFKRFCPDKIISIWTPKKQPKGDL